VVFTITLSEPLLFHGFNFYNLHGNEVKQSPWQDPHILFFVYKLIVREDTGVLMPRLPSEYFRGIFDHVFLHSNCILKYTLLQCSICWLNCASTGSSTNPYHLSFHYKTIHTSVICMDVFLCKLFLDIFEYMVLSENPDFFIILFCSYVYSPS
jgi:hypothetical protein